MMRFTLGVLTASTLTLSGCATINRTIHPTHHEISFTTEIREHGDRTLPDIKDFKECKEVDRYNGDMRPGLIGQGYIELDKTFLEENEVFPLHDLSYYDAYTNSRSYRDRDGFVRTNTTTTYDRKWADVYLKQEGGRTHYKILVKGHWSPSDTSRVNCWRVEQLLESFKQAHLATMGRQPYMYSCEELEEEIGVLSSKTALEIDKTVKRFNKKGLLTKAYVEDVYKKNGRLYVAARCNRHFYLPETVKFSVLVPKKSENGFSILKRGDEVPFSFTQIKSLGGGVFQASASSKLNSASLMLRDTKQEFDSKLF